jgi:hypothetical protein
MPNRTLSALELVIANQVLSEVRARITELSAGDEELAWALRRKVFKELGYDERGKPMDRRKLKEAKWKSQRGLCAACAGPLPEKYCVLDRSVAMKGYTAENTRLLCQSCDTKIQAERGYA